MIRVRVSAEGQARFLVNGTGGTVYAVDLESWQCSCPDAHRRGKGCKHALACWALERASKRSALPARGEGLEHVSGAAARVLGERWPPPTASAPGVAGCSGVGP